MTTVRLSSAAREELEAAVTYYDLESPDLGVELSDEVELALQRLSDFPRHGSPHLYGTRRLVLRRFPFDIVYLPEPQVVVIVAVAHQKRSPGYWRHRL